VYDIYQMEGSIMKQKILIAVTAIIVLLSLSCRKNENSATGTGFTESDTSGTAAAISGNAGYALRLNTSFYTLETDTGEESDKTKWAGSMTLGEQMIIGKARRLTFGGDGKVYDFVEVLREDGKEGYAFSTQVAANSSLAVVVDEKANLYKTAKTSDVTGDIISRKTVVAILHGSENGGFVEIKGYDPVAERSRQNFIRLNSLSRKDDDVQSSILLQIAQPLKDEGADKVRKDALLDAALMDYPDSVFYADIQALTSPHTAVTISTESVSLSSMTVNDDNVNIRDIPDVVAGREIGQLNKDDTVTVNERTIGISTIDGQRARWYHITEPTEGWIFGAYLSVPGR
jgi:hypothetical protein